MTKWEYLYKLLSPGLEINDVVQFLKQMGDEGWELCQINIFSPYAHIPCYAIFKRVKEEGKES